MRSAISSLMAIAVIVTQGLVLAAPATAAPTQIHTVAATSATPRITEADFIAMATALRASDTPRTSVITDGGIELLTFNLEEKVFIQLPYRNGDAYVPPAPRVQFGAVWWSAYVDLNSAEQAALAAGSTATIVGVLTRNPATAGIATTIISVATANGICPGGRTLRLYFPSFLMNECL